MIFVAKFLLAFYFLTATCNCLVFNERCEPGYFRPYGGFLFFSCNPCPVGNTCSGHGPPIICPSGSYCPEEGMKRPIRCEPINNCPFEGLVCPRRYQCENGEPEFCEAGYFCDGSEDGIQPCPPGFFCPKGTGKPVPCQPGAYCPNLGMEKSFPCQEGKYCPRYDLNSIFPSRFPERVEWFRQRVHPSGIIKPIDCPVEYYCPMGSEEPILCPQKYFCNQTGLYKPNVCTIGHYCPLIGLSEPRECSSGFYCPSPGLSSRIPCPTGSFCPNQTITFPVDCPKGFYCPLNGTSIPRHCEPGYFCGETGMIEYDIGSNICPPRHYCPSGSKEPQRCQPGFYCPGNGNQIQLSCPKGFYCPSEIMDEPTLCPVGYFCDQYRLTEPFECKRGYICDDEGIVKPRRCPQFHRCPDKKMTKGITCEDCVCEGIGDIGLNAITNRISGVFCPINRFFSFHPTISSLLLASFIIITGCLVIFKLCFTDSERQVFLSKVFEIQKSLCLKIPLIRRIYLEKKIEENLEEEKDVINIEEEEEEEEEKEEIGEDIDDEQEDTIDDDEEEDNEVIQEAKDFLSENNLPREYHQLKDEYAVLSKRLTIQHNKNHEIEYQLEIEKKKSEGLTQLNERLKKDVTEFHQRMVDLQKEKKNISKKLEKSEINLKEKEEELSLKNTTKRSFSSDESFEEEEEEEEEDGMSKKPSMNIIIEKKNKKKKRSTDDVDLFLSPRKRKIQSRRRIEKRRRSRSTPRTRPNANRRRRRKSPKLSESSRFKLENTLRGIRKLGSDSNNLNITIDNDEEKIGATPSPSKKFPISEKRAYLKKIHGLEVEVKLYKSLWESVYEEQKQKIPTKKNSGGGIYSPRPISTPFSPLSPSGPSPFAIPSTNNNKLKSNKKKEVFDPTLFKNKEEPSRNRKRRSSRKMRHSKSVTDFRRNKNFISKVGILEDLVNQNKTLRNEIVDVNRSRNIHREKLAKVERLKQTHANSFESEREKFRHKLHSLSIQKQHIEKQSKKRYQHIHFLNETLRKKLKKSEDEKVFAKAELERCRRRNKCLSDMTRKREKRVMELTKKMESYIKEKKIHYIHNNNTTTRKRRKSQKKYSLEEEEEILRGEYEIKLLDLEKDNQRMSRMAMELEKTVNDLYIQIDQKSHRYLQKKEQWGIQRAALEKMVNEREIMVNELKTRISTISPRIKGKKKKKKKKKKIVDTSKEEEEEKDEIEEDNEDKKRLELMLDENLELRKNIERYQFQLRKKDKELDIAKENKLKKNQVMIDNNNKSDI